jgi:hypothetical protein
MTSPLLPSGRRPNLAAGFWYDGATADWKLNSDGQIDGVHPVDSGMAMSVLIQQGSVKSSPTTGNTIMQIKYLGGKNLTDQVKAAVMSANPLARLVAAGDVTITNIAHEVRDSRLVFSVDYVNNRTGESRTATSHDQELNWYG